MKTNELTADESLQIIKDMVAKTRASVEGGFKDFLVWGYVSLAITAVVYYLVYTTLNPNWSWLWIAIPAVGYPIGYLVHRGDTVEKHAKTYIDRTVTNIWVVIAIICFVSPFAIMFAHHTGALILPIEALLLSIGVMLTGLTISSKVLLIGGIFGGLIALSMFIFQGFNLQIPLFGLFFVVTMIIPGHILNCKSKCLKS